MSMVRRTKYMCIRDHFNGIKYAAGVVYLLAAAPVGAYAVMFVEHDSDVMNPGPIGGTVDLDGTWRPGPINFIDFSFPVTQGKQGANAKPDYDFDNIGYLFPDDDPTEILYVSKKLPAGMYIGPNSIGYPHSHFVQTGEDQIPNMKGDFRIVCDGTAYNGFATISSGEPLLPYIGGDMLQILQFPPINLWDIGVRSLGGQVEVKGYRGADDIVGDVLIKSFGMWIMMDSPLGSGQPTQK